MNPFDIKTLFKDEKFLNLALTHKSWVNEHPKIRQSNERLEFLGDAILEYIVSKHIYEQFPDQEEGYLTALRANLVNTVNLSSIAKQLELGKYLYLSKGEEESGGRKNVSILANTVEAVIGGLYLDSGLEQAENFVVNYLLNGIQEKLEKPLKDAKSRLQEYVQSQGFPAPKYEVVGEDGPDHDKTFELSVIVNGQPWGRGVGKNKGMAAQEAALDALTKRNIK